MKLSRKRKQQMHYWLSRAKAVPKPRSRYLCEVLTYVGAPLYVREWVMGRIFPRVTITEWLLVNHPQLWLHLHRQDRLMDYREAWLDSLIKEFSE